MNLVPIDKYYFLFWKKERGLDLLFDFDVNARRDSWVQKKKKKLDVAIVAVVDN